MDGRPPCPNEPVKLQVFAFTGLLTFLVGEKVATGSRNNFRDSRSATTAASQTHEIVRSDPAKTMPGMSFEIWQMLYLAEILCAAGATSADSEDLHDCGVHFP